MATKPVAEIVLPDERRLGARLFAWTLDTGDDGEPLDLAGFSDRSVQVLGNISGSTITIQGSLTPTPLSAADYATLRDPFDTSLVLTTLGLHAVSEAVRWVRPTASGGTGTSIKIYLLATGK